MQKTLKWASGFHVILYNDASSFEDGFVLLNTVTESCGKDIKHSDTSIKGFMMGLREHCHNTMRSSSGWAIEQHNLIVMNCNADFIRQRMIAWLSNAKVDALNCNTSTVKHVRSNLCLFQCLNLFGVKPRPFADRVFTNLEESRELVCNLVGFQPIQRHHVVLEIDSMNNSFFNVGCLQISENGTCCFRCRAKAAKETIEILLRARNGFNNTESHKLETKEEKAIGRNVNRNHDWVDCGMNERRDQQRSINNKRRRARCSIALWHRSHTVFTKTLADPSESSRFSLLLWNFHFHHVGLKFHHEVLQNPGMSLFW